ncbi:MAG: hypothetical protein OEM41_07640 [Ignavibacteria bacterium]|nr:hypothetical protein [Ignavibacteria bacterium]
MQIPDGLHTYEFVLLLMGVLLFVTLLVLLVVFAVQRRALKGLIPFFVFPIAMVGFPGYQKISFENGIVTIEKLTQELAENPADSSARAELENTLAEIGDKNVTTPATLLKISKAQAAIGDTVKALRTVEAVMDNEPASSEGKRLERLFGTPRVKIEKSALDVADNPRDSSKRIVLRRELSELLRTPEVSAGTLVAVAKAHAVLGDTAKALMLVDSAMKKDTQLRGAAELRSRLLIHRPR